MERGAPVAKLEHVAEDGEAAARHGEGGERFEGRDHGGGVRVVGVVDVGDAAARDDAPAPAGQREVRERGAARRLRHAEARGTGGGKEGVRDVVRAGQAEAEGVREARGGGVGERDGDERHAAEGGEAVVARVLAGEDGEGGMRGGAGEVGEERPLLVGDAVLRAEELDVRRADRGDDPDVRLGDADEVADLARMVRPHLHDEDVGVGRAVEDRERQAEVVVEVAGGGVDLEAARAEERRDEFLRRRLTGGPRHADYGRLERAAVGARDARKLLAPVDDPHRALRARLVDEGVPVDLLALDRDEQHPRLHKPGIKRRPRKRRP